MPSVVVLVVVRSAPTAQKLHSSTPKAHTLTTSTTPDLPDGAAVADEFDDLGTRYIFSATFGDGQLGVKAAGCQARSGAILDDPTEEAPAVLLGGGEDGPMRLTSAQARYLARNLLSAAAVADDWALP
jgi:hypothetical protein